MKTMLFDPFRVKPFADQPRKRFRGIKQLAESIRLVGQVTPILVMPCHEEKGFDAELVDGERRLQACRLGNMRIKAVLEKETNSKDRFALSVAANFCRQEHDCIEIAEAVQRLRADGRNDQEIAGIFGKTAAWVSQHRAMLRLHPEIQEMLKRAGDEQRESRVERRKRGRMTFSIAMLLVGLEQKQQLSVAKKIINGKLSMAAARNCVLHVGKKTGVQLGVRTSPRQKLMQFWNLMDTTRHRIEPIAQLPVSSLMATLEQANKRERLVLGGQIDQLRDDLGGIARVLKKVSGK